MDALPLLLRYREAARHVWNCFLRPPDIVAAGPLLSEEADDDWEDARQMLFRAIVLRNTGSPAHAQARLRWLTPIDFLRVELRTEVPAMISRIKDQGSYWDHPLGRLSPDDDLRFIDFYDFDESGYRDLLYCQVQIRSSTRNPEITGHLAMIETQYIGAVAVEASAAP